MIYSAIEHPHYDKIVSVGSVQVGYVNAHNVVIARTWIKPQPHRAGDMFMLFARVSI